MTEEVKTLDQPARSQLRNYGVRFGAFNIFFPQVHKPAAAELTLSLARHATDAALARLHDLPRALAEWSRHPAVIQEAVARPEWLLDGWPRICLLSRTMLGQANAAATLAEMAMLVPPIPVQADDWLGLPPGTATRANPPQQGSHGMKLDGARVADLVARNEQLLGMAA